jgi:hypothetical protein
MRIDAGVWTAACVDTDPISCAQRNALLGVKSIAGGNRARERQSLAIKIRLNNLTP